MTTPNNEGRAIEAPVQTDAEVRFGRFCAAINQRINQLSHRAVEDAGKLEAFAMEAQLLSARIETLDLQNQLRATEIVQARTDLQIAKRDFANAMAEAKRAREM